MAFLRPPSAVWPTGFFALSFPLTYLLRPSQRQRYSATSPLPLWPRPDPQIRWSRPFPKSPPTLHPCARSGSLAVACAVSEWGVTPTVAPRGLGGYASLISWSPLFFPFSLGPLLCGPARVAKSLPFPWLLPSDENKYVILLKYQFTFSFSWTNLDDPSWF